MTSNVANFEIGTVLVSIYHGLARYVDFYRVVDRTAHSIVVEELGKRWVSGDGYGQNGTVTVDFDAPTRRLDKKFRVKVLSNGILRVRINDTYTIVWDGQDQDVWTD